MKSYLLGGVLLALATSCNASSGGSVKVTFADGIEHPDTLFVSHALVSDIISASRSKADLKIVNDTVLWKDGAFTFPIDNSGACNYSMRVSKVPTPDSEFAFYTNPDQNITINFTAVAPAEFTATGSELLEGQAKLDKELQPLMEEYNRLIQEGADMAKMEAFSNRYADFLINFIRKNSNSEVAPYALLDLAGHDQFAQLYKDLGEQARKSPVMPILEKQYKRYEENLKKEELQKALSSGNTPAPAFSLPSPDGKKVSLADFKGKWVILDFWGSWCRWCIKGFPELKEAYAKYKDKGLEVIGVDCGDTEDDWKAAITRYDLPWVQVYNGNDTAITDAYGVQGYPTKIIINPEGKIAHITTGEEPSFYTTLDSLMSK